MFAWKPGLLQVHIGLASANMLLSMNACLPSYRGVEAADVNSVISIADRGFTSLGCQPATSCRPSGMESKAGSASLHRHSYWPFIQDRVAQYLVLTQDRYLSVP